MDRVLVKSFFARAPVPRVLGSLRDMLRPPTRAAWVRSRSLSRLGVVSVAIGGGAIVILGAWLSWFSLFGGLQLYRGVDVLNGRLLAAGGGLSVLAGVWFSLRGSPKLRWGIGLLGFALLAFASWSALQLRVIYRVLAADPFIVARVGPGLVVVVIGALVIFASLFLTDD